MGNAQKMKLKEQIYLMWSYGKWQLIVGAVFNVVCAVAVATNFSYNALVISFIIKVLVSALTYYFVREFKARDSIFFYINLGFSKHRLQAMVLAVDFSALVILLTIILVLYG